MQYLLPALIVAAALIAVGLLLRRTLTRLLERRDDSAALTLIQNQLQAGLQQTAHQTESLQKTVHDTLQGLSQQMARSLTDNNRTVGERLDNTAKVIGDVRQQLGQLEESSRRLQEIGKDISSLEQILKAPKLRGSLGELFLGDLLAQILPPDHFSLQYRFQGGDTVDAVIQLRAGLVPIDAKFPLENFRRIVSAETDADRIAARKAFRKDVQIHIDAIARKYIKTDERTFDFALMYIPAENVYYETIIKDDELGGEMLLFNYALQRRVMPVSPNSFYAYLQTIILGLKGMRVEEKSRAILDDLARLQKEFSVFGEAFGLVGKHLDNSTKNYAEAQKRFNKLELKVGELDGLARGLDEPTPPPA